MAKIANRRALASATIDAAAARTKLESATTLHWMHWLIIAASLLITFFAWYYSQSEFKRRIREQFDREADQVVELVLERMRKYEDALWGGNALIQASGGAVELQQWKKYAESIQIQEKYPGINGIGVIHSVSHRDLGDYLTRQRTVREDFRVHPDRLGAIYLPISYITPVQGNEQAVGLDMAHESNRLSAALKARDTGTSQITGPITLVQDSGRTPGFLFYAPFYDGGEHQNLAERRQSFKGLVYAPFVVRKLMEGTLQKDKRHVGIRIFDGTEEIYNEHLVAEADFDPHPLFRRNVDLDLYGRTWKFDIRAAKSFRDASSNSQPLTILVGGLIIDACLILLFVSVSRVTKRALSYADSMNHQLEAKSTKLELQALELRRTNESLSRFNETARGREMRMVELKREVNALLERSGAAPRYPSVVECPA